MAGIDCGPAETSTASPELPLRLDTLTALPDALIDFDDETYRTGMITAVLIELEDVESTLAQRATFAERNDRLIANLTIAGGLLRRGAAVMASDQWSAANE